MGDQSPLGGVALPPRPRVHRLAHLRGKDEDLQEEERQTRTRASRSPFLLVSGGKLLDSGGLSLDFGAEVHQRRLREL